MYKKVIFSAAICNLLLTGMSTTAFAEGEIFAEENFSATLSLATDYVYKGFSLSDNDPVVQGSFDYFHPTGIYAGIWGSSWDGSAWDNYIELGYYIGYTNMLGAVTYDLMVAYWHYPGANDDDAELDYIDFTANLSYTMESVPLSPTLGVTYNFSPEYSGEDGTAHYFAANVDLALPFDFTLGFLVGHNDVEGDKSTPLGWGIDDGQGYDYNHYIVSLTTELKGFELELSYQGMSEAEYFGSIGDDRAVLKVSRTF